ncbi:MAG TPA: uroporphyrinogen decarboxylase family protein [Candidatus Brocadiia bacterium]|nr:uroporphyrinogen decarboxylase family protein [Candidatus Brocadiia bacterium]
MPRKHRTRGQVPFTWGAGCGLPAMAVLAGVRFDRLFKEVDAIVEAYTRGKPLAEDLFGPDVSMGGPCWAGISYGHINGLGAELVFPEDSEVGVEPIYDSLEEGIRQLKKPVDFAKAGLFPFYLDLWKKLQKAFPDHKIGFSGFKSEGPLTTAWQLRGHDFFTDVYEKPDLAKEYLALVTESIIQYRQTERAVNGLPPLPAESGGLADDVSAMFKPAMWPEFVMPYQERLLSAVTTGYRSAHIEDLTAAHLHFLDELGLDSYDPSVSEKLTPALIRDNCTVPFGWRLNSTHYPSRTPDDIQRWVFQAVADGASSVHTLVAREMCAPQNTQESAAKVKAFCRAAKEVKRRLDAGAPREEIRHLDPV